MADGDVAPQPYAVLARKYRSRTFGEVVGQEQVAQTLAKAIEIGRVHHAYLFCGTRGVGKTSMARIFALALNAPETDGPTTEADPASETAEAIFRGDDVDVIEIDAASNTGVDNVRELIENARFRPMRSRFKVYIIDEAHMLSKAAFNALLKILEEPPGHVKFVLATTEPEKILPTILSRVQRFDFKDLPATDVVGHLEHVVVKEGKTADDEALRLVARNGQGSMRDSLSLLDRLLSGFDGNETLTVDTVTRLLGLPARDRVATIMDAIADGNVEPALSETAGMLTDGLGTDAFLHALVEHAHALLIRKTLGKEAPAGDLPGLDASVLDRQAEAFDVAGLAQAVAILEELRRQIRTAGATGRALLDATLVRLCLGRQFTSVEQLLGAAPASPAEKKTADLAAAEPEALPEPAETPVQTKAAVNPDAVWDSVRERLERDQPNVAGLLDGTRLVSLDASTVTLLTAGGPRQVSMLRRESTTSALAAAIAEQLNLDAPPTIDIDVDPDAPTENPTTASNTLDYEADPIVQAAMRELGARVVKVE
ncbi:MAG: DNA polymerase III subunit gamma/tau [Planctomycetota bacterium]